MKHLLVGGPYHGTHRNIEGYERHLPNPITPTFVQVDDDISKLIEPTSTRYVKRAISVPSHYRPQTQESRRAQIVYPQPIRRAYMAYGGEDRLPDAIGRAGLPEVISVLLPSRGRSPYGDHRDPLRESIESLMDNARYPSRIEILVAADPDDPLTALSCEKYNVFCEVQPERYGYDQLNLYFNRLADLASGEWLMLWNDDARMDTGAWDEVLLQTPTDVLIADPWVQGHSPDLCTFPILRRWALHKVGIYSPLTCHCDTWWQDIGRKLGVIKPVDIRIDHQRSDLTGGHNDQTRAEALRGYRQAEFYGPEVQAGIDDYVMKIGRAMSEERY